MYDLSGLKHLIYFSELPLFLLCLFVLIGSWKKMLKSLKNKHWEKGIKTYLVVAVIGILWSVISGGTIIYHIYNPDISCYEGTYLEGSPANEPRLSFFSWNYVFDDGIELKEDFYLDSFSKKKIYNKDFEEGKKYRIYYEEKDDIIVRVEEIG